MTNMIVQNDFEIDLILKKPLMAHLSTVEDGEPRDSPVWFLWEEGAVWVFGTTKDSFISRLKKEPRCAIGIVDFDLEKGTLLHVGIRGTSSTHDVNNELLQHFLKKYLGQNSKEWNQWFIENIVAPLNQMVHITPKTIVAKNVSFFKTG